MISKSSAHSAACIRLSLALLLLTTFSCDSISAMQTGGSQRHPDRPHITVTPSLLEDGGVSLSGQVLVDRQPSGTPWAFDLDDSDWQRSENIWVGPDEIDDKTVWFRLHLDVDPALFGHSVMLELFLIGAAEIWLNEELVVQLGNPDTDLQTFQSGPGRHRAFIDLAETRHQLIAIRFINLDARTRSVNRGWSGITASLHQTETHFLQLLTEYRFMSGSQWFIVGFSLVFFIIHFMLFLFNRRLRFHLWFAIICLLFAYIGFSGHNWYFFEDFNTLIRLQKTMQASILAAFACFVLFLNEIYRMDASRWFKVLLPVLLLAGLAHMLTPAFVMPLMFTMLGLILLVVIEILRISLKAVRRQLDGAWLIGGSISLFILIFVTIAAFEITGVMAPEFSRLTPMHLPYIAFAFALIAMSVFQSRHVSRINLKLEDQLKEVRSLSEKNLAHERSLRESEVRRVRLETEYRRTSAELEKARKLQLSLLPDRFPPLHGYDVHAGMRTAKEVGGDYYDVVPTPQGGQLWAIGDATGHGTDAGFVAAMTKTLFHNLAGDMAAGGSIPLNNSTLPEASASPESNVATGSGLQLDDLLREMSRRLREIGLRRHYMCFGLLNIENGRVSWCSAGIPPVLIVRKSMKVETLESKGMPLGSVDDYPYQLMHAELRSGDMLLAFTDGILEQRNPEGEEFGMDRLDEELKKMNGKPPRQIIARLFDLVDGWRGEHPVMDDISCVCVRKK